MSELPSFIANALELFSGAFTFLESTLLMRILPLSPFTDIIKALRTDSIQEGLAWLNWLVPIGDFADAIKIWLGAVGTYYLWSVVLRHKKVIE